MSDLEEVLERAFEQAFRRPLDPIVENKAEELLRKALAPGSPLSQKLEARIGQGFQRFLDEGIRWDKKKPGYKK